MNRWWKEAWVDWTARLLVGGLFVYAGVTKIVAPQAFADSIATFRLLPLEFINLVALTLPPLEIFAGSLLISGWQRKGAAFSILVLCVFFALALSQALARGLEVDCGCFGSGPPSIWKTWASLMRDLILIGLTILIYRNNRLTQHELLKGVAAVK